MWVEQHNTVCKVVRHEERELAWLDHYLGVPDKGAHFRGGPKRKPLLNMFDNTFPTGLLPEVQRGAAREGIRVEVLDKRVRPCVPDPAADLGWLLDYQEEAVEHAAEKGRGIFHCPTGSGKTEVITALTTVFKCTHLVFVHRKSLLNEIAERVQLRTGEQVGVVGDGTWSPRRVTVAMFQTVHKALVAKDPRALKLLQGAQAIHADECHTTAATSFWQCLQAAVHAYFRFGYSATPFARGDARGLLIVAALGPVLYRIQAQELIDRGAIAKPVVHLVKVGVPPHGADQWHEATDELVAGPGPRNSAVLEVVKHAAKPCLVFVRVLEHGHLLERAFRAAGLPCEFVFGAKKTPQREAAIRRLEHGDTDVLIANVVFQEGVNIPCLLSVVNAAGGKSHITTLQNAGRGMRRRDRQGAVVKDAFEVYDIADVSCGCRSKGADGRARYRHKACQWLERHARDRRRAYLGEGFAVVESLPGLAPSHPIK